MKVKLAKLIRKKVLESYFLIMGIDMRESGKTIKDVERGNYFSLMELSLMDNFKMMRLILESSEISIEIYLKMMINKAVSFLEVSFMEREKHFLKMETHILESLRMENFLAQEK